MLAYVITASFFLAKIKFSERKRKPVAWMTIIILAVLAPLLFFKYTGFLEENINLILSAVHSSHSLQSMEIVFPLGISFYTFSALAYVIDVQTGRVCESFSVNEIS